MKKIAIIGGGIVGLAIAYKLSKNLKIKPILFEKEDQFGKHQSGNNSGVLHCGLSYTPGSLKAELAVRGIEEMTTFCRNYNIEHDICGKVVTANEDYEIQNLLATAEKGKRNGLKNLKFLSNVELKRREPNIRAKKALLVPQEGIVNYSHVMDKLSELIIENDGEIRLGNEVTGIQKKVNGTSLLQYEEKEIEVNLVINCSGLHSDRIYKKLTKKKRPLRIIPFRGEYMRFKSEYKDLIRHMVYPVANPSFPFLGVHIHRLMDGNREIGPNAVLALSREGYKNTDMNIKDIMDIVTYQGMRKFISKNFLFALNEFKSSLSIDDFIKKGQKLFPDLNKEMIEKGGAGVRAQAMDFSGNLIMDFNIVSYEGQLHILNAPSPGATASLAIADYIINEYIIN